MCIFAFVYLRICVFVPTWAQPLTVMVTIELPTSQELAVPRASSCSATGPRRGCTPQSDAVYLGFGNLICEVWKSYL
jgi:hypothetical protein